MRRTVLFLSLAGALLAAVFFTWRTRPTTAQSPLASPPASGPALKPVSPLPVGQVILFSSGVGYFQREGEIEGNARIDLSFPATDINDLLKSLVLQDLGGGKIGTVSYDSHDPVDKALKGYAIDLTYNPSLGQILNQARGEKVEVIMQQSNTTQPGTLTGVVVGMESQTHATDKGNVVDVDMLNLLGAEGMRSVPLGQVQRVRFLNPLLEGELKRALDVLAGAHDSQKKSVSVSFNGTGKRPVRVGYVVENPIWKTSYRLVLGKDAKAHLQGWAIVENASDEDWNGVRMVLVSGRPISFQMNLYEPLYIPRPTVEPELFASLRPPTYNANMADGEQAPPIGQRPAPVMPGNRYQAGGQFGIQGGQFGIQGGMGGMGVGGGFAGGFGGIPGLDASRGQGQPANPKLTFEEMQRRKLEQSANKDEARQVGSALALDPTQGVHSVANAEEIGDYFQYVIDHKVSLPRQKSALLPIVDEPVQVKKVSIFNEAVHAKFPLLGLKLKNTTGQHLMQGPITVFEGGSYAGDSRALDLQPNEERLVSYAIDLGLEVKMDELPDPAKLVSVRIAKGVSYATEKIRFTRTYLIKNRTDQDRVLLVEHPIIPGRDLIEPKKAAERSRDSYRFEVKVAAGKSHKHEVVEEERRASQVLLSKSSDDQLLWLVRNPEVDAKVKAALEKAIQLRKSWAGVQGERAPLEEQLKALIEDQARLRANLEKVPPTSAAHKRFLDKIDQQESEIEKLQDQLKKKHEAEQKLKKEYEDYLANLNVE